MAVYSSYTLMAKPIKALELQYQMIQFKGNKYFLVYTHAVILVFQAMVI